jgi:hypothetical protein
MLFIITAIFFLAIFLHITTLHDSYGETQMTRYQDNNIILTNTHTVPLLLRANNGTFRINTTVINNSSNTIQFTDICHPSLSVIFERNAKVLSDRVLQSCNSIRIRELKPGETTTLATTTYKSYAPANVNSEVRFYYRIIHNGKVLMSNDGEPFSVGPIPFRFTIQQFR